MNGGVVDARERLAIQLAREAVDPQQNELLVVNFRHVDNVHLPLASRVIRERLAVARGFEEPLRVSTGLLSDKLGHLLGSHGYFFVLGTAQQIVGG